MHLWIYLLNVVDAKNSHRLKIKQKLNEICCGWLNRQTATGPEYFLRQKKGQRLGGSGGLRNVSYDCSYIIVCGPSWRMNTEPGGCLLWINTVILIFHKLFIVCGYWGRLIVAKIHSSGQTFSVMLGILQISTFFFFLNW